jgi:hypothetical protein
MTFNTTTITTWDLDEMPWDDEEFKQMWDLKVKELISRGVMLDEIPASQPGWNSVTGSRIVQIERHFVDDDSANEWIANQQELVKKYNKILISSVIK